MIKYDSLGQNTSKSSKPLRRYIDDGLELAFCRNPNCSDFQKLNVGNIVYRGSYGKNDNKDLLYCNTCAKRFLLIRNSPLIGAHLPKNQVHQIRHHATKDKRQGHRQFNEVELNVKLLDYQLRR